MGNTQHQSLIPTQLESDINKKFDFVPSDVNSTPRRKRTALECGFIDVGDTDVDAASEGQTSDELLQKITLEMIWTELSSMRTENNNRLQKIENEVRNNNQILSQDVNTIMQNCQQTKQDIYVLDSRIKELEDSITQINTNSVTAEIEKRLSDMEKTLKTPADPSNNLIDNKIKYCENLLCKLEKEKRSLDIIIKGLVIQEDNVAQVVSSFLLQYFKLQDVVFSAKKLGEGQVILASLSNQASKTYVHEKN